MAQCITLERIPRYWRHITWYRYRNNSIWNKLIFRTCLVTCVISNRSRSALSVSATKRKQRVGS